MAHSVTYLDIKSSQMATIFIDQSKCCAVSPGISVGAFLQVKVLCGWFTVAAVVVLGSRLN